MTPVLLPYAHKCNRTGTTVKKNLEGSRTNRRKPLANKRLRSEDCLWTFVATPPKGGYNLGVARRSAIRVEGGIGDGVHRVAADRGMNGKDVASRVLAWFLSQEENVQALILGHLPKSYRGDAVQSLMGSIIREFGPPAQGDQP